MADKFRFGIGEWYGKSFIHLTPHERRVLAALNKEDQKLQPCIPMLIEDPNAKCTKKGGVCALRQYQLFDSQFPHVAIDREGSLRTTCPTRFRQGGTILRWVGEHILGHTQPLVVKEVGFLDRLTNQNQELDEIEVRGNQAVGNIDMVLVHPNIEQFSWCALEMQAVYFSGDEMPPEYRAIVNHQGNSLPFPVGSRRPDYRSSGVKRLMPQLQIKVPTLRRWGKRMVVVVDEMFFNTMGEMDDVPDISNCDIVWLIIGYNEEQGEAVLEIASHQLTTLERTVEGLTAGNPVALTEFETRIKEKLNPPQRRQRTRRNRRS